MREKDIELHLKNEVKKLGGRAYKFVSPGNSGVPDRLVVLPGGFVWFVELKATGKKTTALQNNQIKYLRNLRHNVIVLDSKEQVNKFVSMVKDVMFGEAI